MKTSTKKEIKGWRNIYTPKNLKVKVSDWLKENGHDDDDARVFEGVTFGEMKACVDHIDEKGIRHINWDKFDSLICYRYMDSYLRDVTFDACFSI